MPVPHEWCADGWRTAPLPEIAAVCPDHLRKGTPTTTRLVQNVRQLRTRRWAKPLIDCLVALAAAFVARAADGWPNEQRFPEIAPNTIQTLLIIIASTTAVIATFAVGSMLSSYTSTSGSRAFGLVLADGVSRAALSRVIGAFIVSVVWIVALKTGHYERGGLFILFVLTLAIFGWVVLTLVRWVVDVARLGRLDPTIDTADAAARSSLKEWRLMPFLGGVERTPGNELRGAAVCCDQIGYVRSVDVPALQEIATDHDLRIMVEAMPGSLLAPGQALVILDKGGTPDAEVVRKIANAFTIGDDRTFDDDPRFCLIVMSEIAARAASPTVNDHGTAIVIIGRFVRLFATWATPVNDDERIETKYGRVIVPALPLAEVFDDAFSAIARDGAGVVEVGVRLQQAFVALSTLDGPGFTEQAQRHSALALAQARKGLSLQDDITRVEDVARMLA